MLWHVMGYCPPSKNTSKLITLPVLKFFNPPVLKLFTPPLTGNKKHEDVKLIHKLLIQRNSWQIKKQSEIWRNTINLIKTLTFRLNMNEWFIYEKGANPFNNPPLPTKLPPNNITSLPKWKFVTLPPPAKTSLICLPPLPEAGGGACLQPGKKATRSIKKNKNNFINVTEDRFLN